MSDLKRFGRLLSGISILLMFAFSANSQQPAQTPVPSNTTSQQDNYREQQRQERELRIRQQYELHLRKTELMNVSNSARPVSGIILRDVEMLYRKTSKKEMKLLAVNKDGAKTKKCTPFLKQNKAELIESIEDLSGLDENLQSL